MRCSEPGRRVQVAIQRPRGPGRWVVQRERATLRLFEQEATEGTEIGSILCFLRYLLLDL